MPPLSPLFAREEEGAVVLPMQKQMRGIGGRSMSRGVGSLDLFLEWKLETPEQGSSTPVLRSINTINPSVDVEKGRRMLLILLLLPLLLLLLLFLHRAVSHGNDRGIALTAGISDTRPPGVTTR